MNNDGLGMVIGAIALLLLITGVSSYDAGKRAGVRQADSAVSRLSLEIEAIEQQADTLLALADSLAGRCRVAISPHEPVGGL